MWGQRQGRGLEGWDWTPRFGGVRRGKVKPRGRPGSACGGALIPYSPSISPSCCWR